MIKTEVIVLNRAGLHTRPAAKIVKLAAKFKSEIFLIREGFKINAKSIIGVMTLAAEQGSKLDLHIDGADEEQAAKEFIDLFNSGFDEL